MLRRAGALALGLLFYFATSGTLEAFGSLRGLLAVCALGVLMLAGLAAQ